MATQFWIKDPRVLFKSDDISKVYPSANMTSEEKLNAITRLIIILTLLGYLISQDAKIVITGLVTLVIIVILYYSKNIKSSDAKVVTKEQFSNPEVYNLTKSNFTQPNDRNPAMNVLLTEIADNPNRKEAAPGFNPIVGEEMNKATIGFVSKEFGDNKIDERLFKDLGDNFNFDQSMRTFHPTPNTRIPNDQSSFAEFCYGDMLSCKEGNELMCMKDNPRYTLY